MRPTWCDQEDTHNLGAVDRYDRQWVNKSGPIGGTSPFSFLIVNLGTLTLVVPESLSSLKSRCFGPYSQGINKFRRILKQSKDLSEISPLRLISLYYRKLMG